MEPKRERIAVELVHAFTVVWLMDVERASELVAVCVGDGRDRAQCSEIWFAVIERRPSDTRRTTTESPTRYE